MTCENCKKEHTNDCPINFTRQPCDCKGLEIEMKEIGGIGKDVQFQSIDGRTIGVRERKLYQCGNCKTIKIS